VKEIIGRKIVACRHMTQQELLEEGWEAGRSMPILLVLDDGMKVYPSRDEEGNGPGAIFGIKDGKMYMLDEVK
jgi:hypothetical protein